MSLHFDFIPAFEVECLPFFFDLAEIVEELTNSIAFASFVFRLAGFLVEFVFFGTPNFVIAVS